MGFRSIPKPRDYRLCHHLATPIHVVIISLIVESFKTRIFECSRDTLILDQTLGLRISAYTNALVAVSVINDLDPSKV
ncbi:hypothetical protein L6452_12478 [Arctium lappa]|uniref:Uncharacterized protein n=1 Tax=Arctium lappa TaxID=4217 RepID=A0ACB9DS03_ARCLA|nr:hypothetical protein L6452_12478 [Arctium lappa]